MVDVIDFLARATGAALYLLVAILAFSETAMFLDLLVPGEVGMVLAGAAGARGDTSLLGLVGAGAFGAVLGDTFSYVLGRRYGSRLVHRWDFVRRRLEPHLEGAHAYFARKGGVAVFGARWVGALRAVVPFVAGTAAMPYPRFLLWNVLASLGWVTTTVTLGWVAGEPAANVVDRIGPVLSAVVVVLLVLSWMRRRRR